MLKSINEEFNRAKQNVADDAFILEAVLDTEEVLPGSEEEIDDVVDADSVPDDVYKQIDKALDNLIGKDSYDDSDVESLLDDDDDVSDEEISDEELDALINENAGAWVDPEGIGAPNTADRTSNSTHQPLFDDHHSVLDTDGGKSSITESSEKSDDEKKCPKCGKPLGDCICEDDSKKNECSTKNESSSFNLSALRAYANGEISEEELTEATKFQKYGLYNSGDAKELSSLLKEIRKMDDGKEKKAKVAQARKLLGNLKKAANKIPDNDFGDWAIDLLVKPIWWFILDVVMTSSKGESIKGMSRSQAISHFDDIEKQLDRME